MQGSEPNKHRVVALRKCLQHKPLMFSVWIYMNALEDRQKLKMQNRHLRKTNEGLRKVIVARNRTIGELERKLNLAGRYIDVDQLVRDEEFMRDYKS